MKANLGILVFSAAAALGLATSGCGDGGGGSSGGWGEEGESHHWHSSSSSEESHWSGGGGGGGGGGGLPNLRDDPAGTKAYDSSAIPGKSFSVSGSVLNDGATGSPTFTTAFYVSSDAIITLSDHKVGEPSAFGPPAGSSVAVGSTAVFPDVPPGIYYVGWIIDSGSYVIESDETDNVVLVPGSAVLVEDAYEDNDTAFSAHFLGGGGATHSLDAAISVGGDEDWFEFTQVDGFQVDIDLTSLPDDYDLFLYADDGTLLFSSQNAGTAPEAISTIATYSGAYFVQVVGVGAASHPSDTYHLDILLE